MPKDYNHVIIFVLITALCIYPPDFNCFNCVVVIALLNCAYVRIC